MAADQLELGFRKTGRGESLGVIVPEKDAEPKDATRCAVCGHVANSASDRCAHLQAPKRKDEDR